MSDREMDMREHLEAEVARLQGVILGHIAQRQRIDAIVERSAGRTGCRGCIEADNILHEPIKPLALTELSEAE